MKRRLDTTATVSTVTPMQIDREVLLPSSLIQQCEANGVSAQDLKQHVAYLQEKGCIGGTCSPDALANKCSLKSNKLKGTETLEWIPKQMEELETLLKKYKIKGVITPRILTCGKKTINMMEVKVGTLSNVDKFASRINKLMKFKFGYILVFTYQDATTMGKKIILSNTSVLDVDKVGSDCKALVQQEINSLLVYTGKCYQFLFDLLQQYTVGTTPQKTLLWNADGSPQLDASGNQMTELIDRPNRIFPICIDLTYVDPSFASVYPALKPLKFSRETIANILENNLWEVGVNLQNKTVSRVLDELDLLEVWVGEDSTNLHSENYESVTTSARISMFDEKLTLINKIHVDPDIEEAVRNGTAKFYIVRALSKIGGIFQKVAVFGTSETEFEATHAACFITTPNRIYSLGFGYTGWTFERFGQVDKSTFRGGEDQSSYSRSEGLFDYLGNVFSKYSERSGLAAKLVDVPLTLARETGLTSMSNLLPKSLKSFTQKIYQGLHMNFTAGFYTPDYVIVGKLQTAELYKKSKKLLDPRFVDVVDSGMLTFKHIERMNELLANVKSIDQDIYLRKYKKKTVGRFKRGDQVYWFKTHLDTKNNNKLVYSMEGPYVILDIMTESGVSIPDNVSDGFETENVECVIRKATKAGLRSDLDCDDPRAPEGFCLRGIPHNDLYRRLDHITPGTEVIKFNVAEQELVRDLWIVDVDRSNLKNVIVSDAQDINDSNAEQQSVNKKTLYTQPTSLTQDVDTDDSIENLNLIEYDDDAVLEFSGEFLFKFTDGMYDMFVSHLPNAYCSINNPGNCSSIMEYIFRDDITCFHKYWQISHPNACTRLDGAQPKCSF
jgi:hypothetical protein